MNYAELKRKRLHESVSRRQLKEGLEPLDWGWSAVGQPILMNDYLDEIERLSCDLHLKVKEVLPLMEKEIKKIENEDEDPDDVWIDFDDEEQSLRGQKLEYLDDYIEAFKAVDKVLSKYYLR